MHRWAALIFPVVALAATPDVRPPDFRVERQPVANGAELLTIFSSLPENTGEIPLVSVLRDTLGDNDPNNDRLRYIWVLTSARPTVLQHTAAFIPFFYWRPDLGKNMDRKPAAILDLGNTSKVVWNALAQSVVQAAAIDSNGALIRASTRRYRANLADQRQVNLMEGLTIVSQLEEMPEAEALFSVPELLEIQARLALAGKTLGGLVTTERLPEAYLKNRTQTSETRGHNWELLRQRAESNGLYFEPLGFAQSRTHALLWIAREDLLPNGQPHKWDGRFLGIADPFNDSRLKNWTGYAEKRYFDESNRPVGAETPGAKPRELIPLALYALEYPKVPLLLADFRNTRKPKNREMLRLAAGDAVSGVLGISKWGNWPYFAGSAAWNFVRSRHGDPNNRAARLRAYSQVRRWLTLDGGIDPALRADLQRRLEILGVNPLEENVFEETEIAERQYDALLRYAADPKGLPARLERDRNAELATHRHGIPARTGLRMAKWFSLGVYSHHEMPDSTSLVAAVGRERRAERQIRFLETVAKSSPQPEVAWNLAEVRRAVNELILTGVPARSAQVVSRLMQQTDDAEIRELCARALATVGAAAGQ
ncbi:MAG TPA: hypothetical protein VE958_04455 [Bryobacteraceae bacterium]|nr:hypothetical protein [Bryobacteraceae bacterium]